MAPGRARDERKERQWRRWIGEWRASGLSVRAFCDRCGLATPNFYHWRRVLERRAAEKVRPRIWLSTATCRPGSQS